MTKVIPIETIVELGLKYQSIVKSSYANNDDTPTLNFADYPPIVTNR
jgi:hypothetical protein